MLGFAAADRVQIVLHLGRELVVDQASAGAPPAAWMTENAIQVGTRAVPRLEHVLACRIVSMIEA